MAGILGNLDTLPYLLSPCMFGSRWTLSVNLFAESAVTSAGSLHHTEHLCKQRATAAKHRCWQTVNIPPPVNNVLLSKLCWTVFLCCPPTRPQNYSACSNWKIERIYWLPFIFKAECNLYSSSNLFLFWAVPSHYWLFHKLCYPSTPLCLILILGANCHRPVGVC